LVLIEQTYQRSLNVKKSEKKEKKFVTASYRATEDNTQDTKGFSVSVTCEGGCRLPPAIPPRRHGWARDTAFSLNVPRPLASGLSRNICFSSTTTTT